jgi:hypothetical protein
MNGLVAKESLEKLGKDLTQIRSLKLIHLSEGAKGLYCVKCMSADELLDILCCLKSPYLTEVTVIESEELRHQPSTLLKLKHLTTFCTKHPNLKRLRIEGNWEGQFNTLTATFAKSIKYVEEICFAFLDETRTRNALDIITSHCSNLKRLSLRIQTSDGDVGFIDNTLLEYLYTSCPALNLFEVETGMIKLISCLKYLGFMGNWITFTRVAEPSTIYFTWQISNNKPDDDFTRYNPIV